MAAILNSAIMILALLDSAILVCPLKLTHTCQDWFPPFAHKKTSLIHSDSTWWWQPSGILPLVFNHFQQKNLTHSFWLNLMMAAILNSTILDSAILHKKNFTHSFWLKLMMAAILNSAMLDSATAILESDTLLSYLRFTQKHSHSTLTLTYSNWNWLSWWWQPSWIFHLGFSHLSISSQTQTCQYWFPPFAQKKLYSHFPPHYLHKKNFTLSFWLNLMIVSTLNSAILNSDTAIMDSETLLSSLRFTQKHSHSTLTLTQTNSISLI